MGFDMELVVSVNTEEPSRVFDMPLTAHKNAPKKDIKIFFSDQLESQVCRAPRRRWSWSVKASSVYGLN